MATIVYKNSIQTRPDSEHIITWYFVVERKKGILDWLFKRPPRYIVKLTEEMQYEVASGWYSSGYCNSRLRTEVRGKNSLINFLDNMCFQQIEGLDKVVTTCRDFIEASEE
jgi:hypothetical protein